MQNQTQVDTLPYKTFNKLKTKYPVKTIVIRDSDMGIQGKHLAFKSHREYVDYQFAKIGVEVTRWNHNYISLTTAGPLMGLVFLANDSTVDPGIEVHALIGHNAKYMEQHETKEKL